VEPGADPPAPGREFLLRKQRTRDAGRDLGGRARDLAEEIVRTFAPVAERIVRRELPPEAGGQVFLDAVLLVAEERRPALEEVLQASGERAREAGCELVVSGPWPAYHFVSSRAASPGREEEPDG
jgi:hypothetical protein